MDDVCTFCKELDYWSKDLDCLAYPSVAIPGAARTNAWAAYRAIIK